MHKSTPWYVHALVVFILLVFHATPSRGWVYPEHCKITLVAIHHLDSGRRTVLEQLRAQARQGHESRLSLLLADTGQGENPSTIDYAAWPAIAGDHSCSAANMLHTILESEWILRVADITARLGNNLASSANRSDRINALRSSDFDLLNADKEYATRAGANNVHFLLAFADTLDDFDSYIGACRREGAELNSLGVYTWYHARALAKVSHLASEELSPGERSIVALADEAYALHFLQDAFAAGHVAGTWGNASLRKGTHDYYNEHGLRTVTWNGERTVLVGDAWMRAGDALQAAHPVRESLHQLVNAPSGSMSGVFFEPDYSNPPDSLNTCKLMVMPPSPVDSASKDLFNRVLRYTPVPGLPTGTGELPRFRSELGPFVGVTTAGRIGVSRAGFAESETGTSLAAGLEIAVRLGVGLAGVMNEAGDGLAILLLVTEARLEGSDCF